MGDNININSGDNTNVQTGGGVINATNKQSQDIQTVYNMINKTISESDSNPADKQDAKELLEKLNEELSKPKPDKSRAKRCFDYIVGIVPKVAEKVDWLTVIESVFR